MRRKNKTRKPRLRKGRRRSGYTNGLAAGLVTLVAFGGYGWLWWERQPQQQLGGSHRSRSAPGDVSTSRPKPSPTNSQAAPSLSTPTAPAPQTVIEASASNPDSAVEGFPSPEFDQDRERFLDFGLGSPVQNVFQAQLALGQYGISPGSLDGVLGSQTRAALRAFQEEMDLPVTGRLDDATRDRLRLEKTPFRIYTVTGQDLDRLAPVPSTWLGKSQQDRLNYESILELVAEEGHAHPDYIRQINPDIDWQQVTSGTAVAVPNAGYPPVESRADHVRIYLSNKTLKAFGPQRNLLAHFPCSIARKVEKRPVGKLTVTKVARNPNYRFDPDIFPESPEARRLDRVLMIPPGPNNPVGTAWIGLDKPGYGIHGTPNPEAVGRTESHGCFRLANWNAEYLLDMVRVGTPVWVEP